MSSLVVCLSVAGLTARADLLSPRGSRVGSVSQSHVVSLDVETHSPSLGANQHLSLLRPDDFPLLHVHHPQPAEAVEGDTADCRRVRLRRGACRLRRPVRRRRLVSRCLRHLQSTTTAAAVATAAVEHCLWR